MDGGSPYFKDRAQRTELRRQVEYSRKRNPVTAGLGSGPCGKTTLAREIGRPENAAYFDLEDPQARVRLANRRLPLEPLRGVVILDENQRRPELPMWLRVLADRQPLPGRFTLLGSASLGLRPLASDNR